MMLASIEQKLGKPYQKRIYNIPSDIHLLNTNLVWVRGQIYEESECIKSCSCIVEIAGYLSLSEKFRIWSEYGKPETDIYFCVERGVIVTKDKLDYDNGYIWPIGWISTDNYVVIYVELLMLLNEYYHINNATKLGNYVPAGIEIHDSKSVVLQ